MSAIYFSNVIYRYLITPRAQLDEAEGSGAACSTGLWRPVAQMAPDTLLLLSSMGDQILISNSTSWFKYSVAVRPLRYQ